MKNLFKKTLSVLLAVVMLIPTGILSVFAQSEDNSGANTETDVSYDSTNAVGSMILDATQEESGEETDYVIQSVDIEGKFARVDFINADACTIVVSIYDESGKTMLGSGKEEIEAKEAAANDSVTVTIEIDEMPEYFLVKAFMLDENNAPLCHNYETKEYTQAFEEFLAKTTDDFDEDLIINLDEADDNNFLVVSDDAIVIDVNEGVNTVTTDDYENGLYVIENADSQFTSLKPGDMIYYQYGDAEDEYILTTVGSIDVNGDTVTIATAESGELTDYFDYVKIDVNATQTTFDASEMDEDVTHETEQIQTRTRGNTDIDGSASVADKWTIDKTFDNAVKLAASIEFKVSLSVKIYVDEALDYTYIESVIKYSGKITASITGEVKIPPIPLGRIGFDTGKLGIVAAIKFDFVVEGEVEITLTYTLEEGAVGMAYSSGVGLIDKRQAPTTNFTPELKSEVTIFIGVSITPEIQATKYIEISLEAKAGIEIKGTIFDTGNDELHSCSVCVDGVAAFKLEATAAVRFFDWIENEWTLIEIEVKLGSFYLSFDIGFGFGKCPNISSGSGGSGGSGGSDNTGGSGGSDNTGGSGGSGGNYTVTHLIVDISTFEPVSGAAVTVTKQYDSSGTIIATSTTDANGRVSFTLPAGYYVYTLTHSNYDTEIFNEIFAEDVEETIKYITSSRTVTASGTCGDNLTWTLYDDGELVIDGTGAMGNYTSEIHATWYSYSTSITKVTIGNGVTTIDSSAFYDCDNLTSVTIPDSVTTIGGRAFYDCDGLTSVTIGNSVTTIGSGAFCNCDNLTSVTIPDSVTTIGSSAFSSSNGLTSITIPDSVTTIGKYAFYNCSKLASVTIGNGVTSIGYHAFSNCSKLASVTIGNGVTSIGNQAFYRCDAIESVYIENIESWLNISFYASDSNPLSHGTDLYVNGTLLTELTIPDGVTSIGNYAFFNCDAFTSVTIPDSVTTIGSSAFSSCNGLTSVTIGNGVTTIGEDAFSGCDSLTSVTIPDSVTTIGDYAFYYCTNIASVTIGNSVTTIGYRVFEDCTGLTSITIPDSVTTIGKYAFRYCTGLESVTVDENNANYSSDEYGVLFDKDKTELIQYPTSNERTEYIIPDSVTTIGDFAFYKCKYLTSVTIPDSVTTIGKYAFDCCTGLESVTIPDSVTTIGDYAFNYCIGLTSVTIPDSVTIIGKYAFQDCTGLTSVTIGNGVTTIGNHAFSSCDSLTSVTIPASVTTIDGFAFFYCTSLESITIHDSVTTIGKYAFRGCTGLETVYYTGTQEQWNAISIGSDNTPLTNANIICSDTVATASVMALSFDDEIAAYSPRAAVQNETVTSAILGNSYVILVVKDKNAEDLLAAENLIYIDQKIAESETLTFDFDLNGETDYDVIITNAELYHSHKYTAVVTAPDCTEQGYTTYTCYCGDTYTDSYIDALGHTEEIISGTPADCINEGITDGIICSVCKAELTAQELILAKGHTNTNGDNYCDVCGYDFALDCSHNCHSNNAFLKFFWQIALFFSKLFNIQSNRYCDCGIAHW